MSRIRELDTLRGIWSILIFLFHSTSSSMFMGWSRVDFFFVLSGYLITAQMAKNERTELIIFCTYIYRLIRLIPAYYVLLIIIFMIDKERFEIHHIIGMARALSFTQNIPRYWGGTDSSYFPQFLLHTWALEITVQYTLIWPLLVWLTGRCLIIPMAIWILINAVVLRTYGLHPWTLPGRCDGFMLGSLLALLLGMHWRAEHRFTKLGLSLTALMALGYLILFSILPGPMLYSFDRPLNGRESLAVLATNFLYTSIVGLIICYAGSPILVFLRVKCIEYIGSISYCIYIFSYSAICVSGILLGRSFYTWGMWRTLLALALSILVAVTSRVLVEQPLLIMVRRLIANKMVTSPSD